MVYVDKKCNPFTPHEGYFSWSTENIFRLTNILRHAKYSKIENIFIKYFMPKQTVLRNEVFLIHLEENISEKNKAKHHT